MSIKTVCEAIKAIGAGVDGIRASFTEPPLKLDTAELPALYPFAGAATYDWETAGDETGIVTRQYRIHVAIVPRGQDDEITAERLGRSLLEAAVLRFACRPSLGNTQGVQTAKVLSDGAIVLLPEYGGKFIGFEIILQVQEYIGVEIIDYDV